MPSAYQEWLASPRQATPMCRCGHEWVRHSGIRRQCEHCDSWYRTPVEKESRCGDCHVEDRIHAFREPAVATPQGEKE